MKKYIVPAIIAGVVIATVAIVALGGNGDSTPVDPMTGQRDFDIPVQDPELVAEGEALYQASCAACHGADLRGTAIGPSHLSVIYQPGHHTDASFASAVFNGVAAHHWRFGNMPPVAGLTDDDMVRIIAFVRETQRIEGFEPYPPR